MAFYNAMAENDALKDRIAEAIEFEGPDTVAAVILENDGTMSVVTSSQLGNGSVLNDVPGWPQRKAV